MDAECYSCGERVPGAKVARSAKRKSKDNSAAPVAPFSNGLVIAALVLTAVCFLTEQKMPVAAGAALSGILFTAKIVTDRRAQKRIQAQ